MHLALRDFSFDSLSSAIVLTPNRLFTNVLATQLTRERLKHGQQTWERPTITTVYAWMANLWQEQRYAGAELPTLLSPGQERALWQRFIEKQHPDLFDYAGTARLAIEATRMLAEWDIPLEHEAWDESKDADHFRSLFRVFRRECRDRGCITRSDLWKFAPAWAARVNKRIILAGFDSLSPGLRSFTATLHPLAAAALSKKRIPAVKHESIAAEIEFCARWARLQMETDGHLSVGAAVPLLNEHRNTVNRTFTDVFYPSSLNKESSAFHIHSAESLSTQPVVGCADLLLELGGSDLDIADASAILRSPYLAGADAERSARSLADLQLRQRRDIRVTLQQVEYRGAHCPLLQSVWAKVRSVLRAQPSTASLAHWSEWITDLLSATGWPGERELTPAESAAVDGWKEALTQLASLSYVFPPVPYEVARRELRRVLGLATIAPEGDFFSPVQIVDAAGAAGLQFDAAALCGLSEGSWPPQEPSQPFIPLRLQRQAGISATTVASAGEKRRLQTMRLLSAGRTAIATFTEVPAPLVSPLLSLKGALPKVWEGSRPMASFPVEELEVLEDESAPALAMGQPAVGGVSVIKAQSLCPFQAFARYRLLADAPEEACFGLDARDRGGFLHKALEYVWRTLETSSALKSLSDEALRNTISEAVTQAVREDGRSSFHELVSDTERRRLNDVLYEWLRLENTRKIPFRVEHLEEKKTVDLAGLPLNLRVDRIDRLADGSVLLLDYKSGQPSAKDLLGERPREPQLLVYASAIADEVDGVYIAQVRAREVKAQGMALHEHFPESRKARNASDWRVERQNARERLESIAAEFVSGHAAVNPQSGACTYCGMNLLCRVAEAGADSSDDDPDE